VRRRAGCCVAHARHDTGAAVHRQLCGADLGQHAGKCGKKTEWTSIGLNAQAPFVKLAKESTAVAARYNKALSSLAPAPSCDEGVYTGGWAKKWFGKATDVDSIFSVWTDRWVEVDGDRVLWRTDRERVNGRKGGEVKVSGRCSVEKYEYAGGFGKSARRGLLLRVPPDHVLAFVETMGKPALSLAALHAQLLAMVMDGGMKDALPLACAIPNEQMSTAKYRTHLIRLNIIEESDNDMDVFHIVASAHGGADHPHNYNIAQGSGYNRSIGARYDDLNIYFVGKARAQKAIQVSMDLGNTSRRRNGKQPIKYTPQHSSTADGEANYRYQAGERMFKCMRGDKNEVEEASRRPEEEEEGKDRKRRVCEEPRGGIC